MNTILQKKNIILNCQSKAKEDVIKEIGKIFYDDGYTTEKYTQAMLDKEKVFNTAIGNAVAIPHGIEEGKCEVKKSVSPVSVTNTSIYSAISPSPVPMKMKSTKS